MSIVVLVVLFMCIAGLGKYISDKAVQDGSVLDTWENKYKLVDDEPVPELKKPWYYFGMYKPEYKERFPFSTTALVALTDRWHLGNLIQTTFTLGILFPI